MLDVNLSTYCRNTSVVKWCWLELGGYGWVADPQALGTDMSWGLEEELGRGFNPPNLPTTQTLYLGPYTGKWIQVSLLVSGASEILKRGIEADRGRHQLRRHSSQIRTRKSRLFKKFWANRPRRGRASQASLNPPLLAPRRCTLNLFLSSFLASGVSASP